MLNLKTYSSTFVLILSIISCNAQTSFIEGETTIIKNVIDLKGEELVLPKNATLKFEKGGCIKNGRITAYNAYIEGYKQDIFDGVQIAGQWNVHYISTEMFKDISSLNSLKNLFALASDTVTNVITIPAGNYEVAANQNGSTILSVPSNTEVIVNGTITMLPNDFSSYYIIGLKGANIHLHGRGEIIGDKHSHTGTKGEWGMGLNLSQCNNVDISDLTISSCWGDCIYIGTESADIHINNCTLIDGRRQGISITSANKVHISNCRISKVGGTDPQYGIDVEPNKGDVVDNVVIENVEVFDCYGGILTYGKAENAQIGSVVLKGCRIYGCVAKYPLNFQTGQSVEVVHCEVRTGAQTAILFQSIQKAVAVKNVLTTSNRQPIKIIFGERKTISGNSIIKP